MKPPSSSSSRSSNGSIQALHMKQHPNAPRVNSMGSYSGSPAPALSRADSYYRHSSQLLSEKYSQYNLSPSPQTWGTPLLIEVKEPDDDLHNPDPVKDKEDGIGGVSFRGFSNVGCLTLLMTGIVALFVAYPVLSEFLKRPQTTQGGFNLGGINATGQVPAIPGNYGLIDRDTPPEAYTKSSYRTGEELVLVFSDEFNTDGRTFYPGDDPYWEAVDLHYWGTRDLEWYDPAQVTTNGGHLQLTLDRVANRELNHNLEYKSGMIQTWNKFCFTGGLIEASVRLPGSNTISGLWPAIWTMGNLGRAGYGASLEGLWPYSYDSCNVGTLPNQTYPGLNEPIAALENGDPYNGDVLSYLPGQRLSACTCGGEAHPGPVRDGRFVGRAAPEIDLFEAAIHDGQGVVSLSAQWAPYNAQYAIHNTSGEVEFDDPALTEYNTYVGGVWQQTTSGLSLTNQRAYELTDGDFAVYGFEYKSGFDDGYITWINDGQRAWTLFQAAMDGDTATEIGERLISREPMYIIANLGFSENFGTIEYELLTFPTTMSVDWIRVYQPANQVRNIGCNPPDYPTAAYIETYKDVYSNPNITTWADAGQAWPRNSLVDQC
ncbi:beta-glucan synthesis-associated protein SKN1 [Coprinopsis marcescibilis]|uniref:Beta-glucan synthesis-associated protein SKN1 n=1 Tax=Coprinopsis marcescibilis TaxID=230819 RepID=A0A5C3KIA9_COPMA|nr:beta-glucan synthesis-associated protein SKN1 [Coprinopsis marcescibilis]